MKTISIRPIWILMALFLIVLTIGVFTIDRGECSITRAYFLMILVFAYCLVLIIFNRFMYTKYIFEFVIVDEDSDSEQVTKGEL